MDAKDRRLLAELDRNPRLPLTALARRLRVSPQVADYRLRRLRSGVIAKLGPVLNFRALALEHYRVFVQYNAKKGVTDRDIFAYLQGRPEVYWAGRIGGKYDLVIVLFVFDFAAFDWFIDAFNARFPGLIKDYKACYGLEHRTFRHKYLHGDHGSLSYGYKDAPAALDELDRRILAAYKDDCRRSALEVGRNMGVSYKTVQARLRALEQRRVILGYRLFLKKSEEQPFIVLFSYKDYAAKAEARLLAYLGAHARVTQTVRLFGLWNLFVHVRLQSNEELQRLIIELRDAFPIIDEFEVIPVFEDIAINLAAGLVLQKATGAQAHQA